MFICILGIIKKTFETTSPSRMLTKIMQDDASKMVTKMMRGVAL